MGPPHPQGPQAVWKIRLGQLGPNLQEAAELADVLQEVSAHIQVTGLTRTLTARTSTSSGNPTHLSTKERIRRAVPLDIDAGNVPWDQLVAVVSSTALQEPNSPAGRMQPQVLEVNSGGAVYFLFFKLKPQQQQQQQPVINGIQQAKQQSPVLTQQQQQQQTGAHGPAIQQMQPTQQQAATVQPGQPDVLHSQQHAGTQSQQSAMAPTQQQQQHQHQQQPQRQRTTLPLLQLHQQRSTAREGVAVLKVGASRLAMQAEQFANELTRHLGIAAPDCRIVRQVGSSAAEWSAVEAAVQRLAEPQQAAPTAGNTVAGSSTTAAAACNSSASPSWSDGDQTTAATAAGSSGDAAASGCGSSGCQVAAELLAELQHLPCFLLMAFVEGSKLSDCPQAVDAALADVGQLCEDVGRLFLLDMLLGNADRMSCPELGWRGNANNLLYAQSGSRHAGRAVAIDSCVARRPPALKASAEDAAVERLSQLVLAVPGMSLALLQQLLGSLRQKQQLQQKQRRQVSLPSAVGLCSALSMESFHGSCSGQAGGFGNRLPSSAGGPVGPEPTSAAAVAASEVEQSSLHKSPAAAAVAEDMAGVVQSPEQSRQPQLPVMGQARVCKTSLGEFRGQVGLQDAAGLAEEARFTEEEVARFQAGLRQCLDGVLQIKGLLEMVSAKIAEWIAEFVEDVVRQNPALLPTPASPGPGSLMRSPRPSPRVSGRGSFTNIRLEPAAHGTHSSGSSLGGVFDAVAAAGAGATGTPETAHSSKGPAAAASGGGGLSGNSFSSRLQAAATAGGGSAGGSGPGSLVPSPQQQQQRQPSPEPAGGLHQSSPLARSPRGAPAVAAAAAPGEAEHGEAAVGVAGAGSSIAMLAGMPPKGTPPKGLFKQLVGGSTTTKTPQPLSRRFAAIKAAICSPKHSSNRSSTAFQQSPADPAIPPPCNRTLDPTDNSCTPPPAGAHASGQLTSRSSDSKQQPQQQQQQQSAYTPCSPPHSINGSRTEPRSGPGDTRSPLDRAWSTSSDLATAVAAALSPRANAMQAEALAGVFGGRRSSGGLHRSFNGTVQQLDKGGLSFGGHSVGGHSAGGHSTGRYSLNSVTEWCESVGEGSEGKPPCARRVTWSASDESLVGAAGPFSNSGSGGTTSGGAVLKTADGTSILEMPAVKAQGVSSSGGTGSTPPSEPLPVPSGWFNSSPSAGLAPAAAAKLADIHSNSNNGASNSASTGNTANSSRNSSSSPVPAPAVQGAGQGVQPGQSSLFGVGPGKESGTPAHASPSPGGVDSFFNRAYNTRHLSFTSGGGAGYADGTSTSSNSPAGVAASMQAHHQQQQQRSSSSSLQVLASLQLDATLASITQEARHDGALAERLAHWKTAFREKGGELSAAIASWQERHQLAAVLSTGFLDGSHPIVDAYELGVRLQHMLRRLTALAAGALVQVPITVLPGVFLGNAVAADSHHLLQYLGVTHVLNAAQELQLTPDPGMFHVLRVAIRDEEEEDVTTHFHMAQSWIDAALASGGAVLVHCHEGKSRSVTLLLAYLMISRGMNLAAAMAHMRAVHPKASPNAGFMAQLMRIDQQLHGSCSIQHSELPRAKPEARICSICGAAAGISYESLVRHTKAKHGLSQPPQASPAGSKASAPP